MRTIDAPSALCELATVINKGDFNIGFDKSPRDYCDIAIRVPLKSGEYLFVEVEPTVEKTIKKIVQSIVKYINKESN